MRIVVLTVVGPNYSVKAELNSRHASNFFNFNSYSVWPSVQADILQVLPTVYELRLLFTRWTALRRGLLHHHHHHHHHPRISSRRKSWHKTSGPLCVTYYTTAAV